MVSYSSLYFISSDTLALKFLGDRDTSPHNISPKRGSDVEADEHLTRLKMRHDKEEVEENLDMVVSNHDPTCSEGVIKCNISNISNMTGKLLSPPIYIRDMPWYTAYRIRLSSVCFFLFVFLLLFAGACLGDC